MKKFLLELTLKQRLALLAVTLGLFALLIGSNFNPGKAVIDLKELANEIDGAKDHVSVEELADWIIAGKMDYKLIDIRTEKEFNEYHIPGAINLPLPKLIDHPFEKKEKLVIYSQGGIHSAQAWYLLRAKGYRKVYFIMGGLDDWKEQILFPAKPAAATPEALAKFNKMKEVSKFFGGTPQDSAAVTGKAVPSLTMPKISGGNNAAGGAAPKKKKEGC